MNVIEIAQHLIRCPSVTPAEAGALTFLQDLLGANGFECTRLPFSHSGTATVDNLFARAGTGTPHLCFAGHTDVVPPGDESAWRFPPFSGEIADGYLYGRGACDMKGEVAAFAAAAMAFCSQHTNFSGSISLLITGDEEGPAINGTVKVLDWLRQSGQAPDHCLVGEPTCTEKLGDTIKIGRRGSVSFEITATGIQGHSAYPHKAENPVPRLARLIDRLAQERLDEGSEHFDPSTLSVTSFDVGNPAYNVIPARAVARLNIRFNDRHSAESLAGLVERHCALVETELGGNFKVEWRESARAFLSPPDEFVTLLRKTVAAETGVTPALSTSGGTSDARFIRHLCPVAEFGLTNHTIHQSDERIAVDEVMALERIYRALINGYFPHGA